jgi:hypothetical protein
MRRALVQVVATILIVSGALGMATGQIAALVTGQFARWDRLVEEEHRRVAKGHVSSGPSVPLHVPFMCCLPLLFPAGYAWIAIWCMRHPITDIQSRMSRGLIHVVWAGWCAGVVTFFLAFGSPGAVWGEPQWEWPGFFLLSVGSWLSVLGHGMAALWCPASA